MNNLYCGTAIAVPTKTQDSSPPSAAVSGAGALGATSLRRGSSISSMASLDVAATVYSSMQELESRGRNLSSLGSFDGMNNLTETTHNIGGAISPSSLGNGGIFCGFVGDPASAAARGQSSAVHPSLNGLLGITGEMSNNNDRGVMVAQRDQSFNSAANKGHSSGSAIPNHLGMMGICGAVSNSNHSQAGALRQLGMEELMLQSQQGNQNNHHQNASNNKQLDGLLQLKQQQQEIQQQLDQLNQQQSGQHQVAMLENIQGRYAPMKQSQTPHHGGGTDRRGSGSSSFSDVSLMGGDFTPQEIMQEVNRRKSQLQRSTSLSSLDDLLGLGGKAGGMGMNMSREASRDNLADLYKMMFQPQQQSTNGIQLGEISKKGLGGSGRANGFDSKPSVIMPSGGLTAPDDKDAKQGQDAKVLHQNILHKKNKIPGNKSDKKRGPWKKRSLSEESKCSAVSPSHVEGTSYMTRTKSGDEEGGRREDNAKKRRGSCSSFDALLSVFGDELAELDREKEKQNRDNKKKNGSTSNGSNDQKSQQQRRSEEDCDEKDVIFFNNLIEKNTKARQSGNANEKMIDGTQSHQQQQPPLLSSGPMPEVNMSNITLPEMRKMLDMQMNENMQRNSMRALSSMQTTSKFIVPGDDLGTQQEMMKELREQMALRDHLMSQHHQQQLMGQQFSFLLGTNNTDNTERLGQIGTFGGGALLSGNMNSNTGASGKAETLEKLQVTTPLQSMADNRPLPLPTTGRKARQSKPVEDENKNNLKEELQKFLDEYGPPAKEAQTNLLDFITKTEESLATLHDWDRSRGLRKCHSRTVVKTRRSRARLKAFLLGVDQPKEMPRKQSRKRAAGGSSAADEDLISVIPDAVTPRESPKKKKKPRKKKKIKKKKKGEGEREKGNSPESN